MPSEMKQQLGAAKSSARTPWWQFSGVAGVGVLMLLLPLIPKFFSTVEEEPVPIQDYEELSDDRGDGVVGDGLWDTEVSGQWLDTDGE